MPQIWRRRQSLVEPHPYRLSLPTTSGVCCGAPQPSRSLREVFLRFDRQQGTRSMGVLMPSRETELRCVSRRDSTNNPASPTNCACVSSYLGANLTRREGTDHG